MSRPRLFVTRKLPPDVETRAARDYDAVFNTGDNLPTRESIVAGAQEKDGLLVTVTDRIDADLIRALPESIRIISTFSVGYDHIDVAAARARGIAVTNTPDVLTDATAEIALLLMLGAARNATASIATLRSGNWRNWAPTGMLGTELTGKRLGILGLGRIGRATAQRARAFGMEIHYHNRSRLDAERERGAIYHDDIAGLFGVSDILSIHCASTPETRGLINRDTIAHLPEGAIIVNTARGDIVDDEALIEALAAGRLAAAGLDVFNNEPNIHPGYLNLSNAFLLPHLGSATLETRNAMGFRALDNLDAFFRGQSPRDLVEG
ncbi:D-glycerate dehydrogenase [Parvibaculum sp.]|jgi:glyoxylate reductase|uniref:2-hydroxyacid dehydrogenase n=1 Tax=Parvibaculum sp. TaxID=2024848 RepID=UPI001B135F7D|nr:D-glycerate dehydrogenase [Parvibaculum sp.]MBO6635705.1 D-glycerate dehydrogenase [Parvibaculum sp.]MBO6680139.1 D-glycerate dehydrogenase [Parvibaculum sp.]MBO6683870.1 D-glycerate dehydrogenase [Parvibaculum sp.]MBO6904116.1 D-glycerate dehydrogenase [Parvibaculum sp.]